MLNRFLIFINEYIGSYVADLFAALVVAFAVYWFFKYDLVLLGKINGSLRIISQHMKTLQGCDIQNLHRADEGFGSRIHPVVAGIWEKYYRNSRDVIETGQGLDIREYFNVTSALTLPAARREAEVKPVFLLFLGAFGTFSVLVLGMQDGEINIYAAFGVFFLATALSILLMLADRALYWKALSQLHAFQNHTRQKIPQAHPALYWEILRKEQQKQSLYLEAIRNGLLTRVEDLTSEVQKNQQEGMERLARSFLEQLNTSVGNQMTLLGENIEEISASLLRVKEDLENMAAGFTGALERQQDFNSASQIIVSTIVEYQQHIQKSAADLAAGLDNTGAFIKTLSRVSEDNLELLQEMNDQRKAIKEESSRFIEDMWRETNRVHEHLSSEMETLVSSWTNNNKGMLESLERHTRRLTNELGSLNKKMESSAALFAEKMHQGTSRTLAEFDEALGEITLRLSGTLEEIRTSIDNLPDVFRSLSMNKDKPGDDDVPE